MVLMVFLSSRISPFTSTVIFFERSPVATAVVTSAMLRTWPVKLPAMKFTLSVRSFHVPATPRTSACPPSMPSVPTSRAMRVTSDANDESWSTMVLTVFLSSRISPLTSTVIFFDKSPLATAWVTSSLLRACDTLHVSLATQLAFGADLARHPRDFRRERTQLIDHGVDGVLELEDLALDVHRDLLRQVARRDRGGHVGNVAHLRGQVARHRVHTLGQVLPRPGHALH